MTRRGAARRARHVPRPLSAQLLREVGEPLSAKLVAEALELRTLGHTQREIARTLDVDRERLRAALAGVDTATRKRR